MSLQQIAIPEHVRSQLIREWGFIAHAITAWRESAATPYDLLEHNTRCSPSRSD